MPHPRSSSVQVVITVLVATLLLSACSGAAPAATTALKSAATATAAVASSPSPTVAPTEAPSPTVTCAVVADHVPIVNVKFHMSGTGFKPDVNVTLKVNDAPTFNDTDSPTHPAGLHSAMDGSFGPYEMYYDTTEAPGTDTLVFSDGICSATYSFTVPKP